MASNEINILSCKCGYPEPIVEYDDGWDVICPRCNNQSSVILGLDNDDRNKCIQRWNNEQ